MVCKSPTFKSINIIIMQVSHHKLKTIMKKWTLILIALSVATSVFCQFKPTFNLSDSLVLKKNPYFYKDKKRPYNKDPRTWSDFPKNSTTIQLAEEEIEKATKENDYYRVLQLSYLGLFRNEGVRMTTVYSAEVKAYMYSDPWLMLYVTKYLIEHPINHSETKLSLVSGMAYSSALTQKDSEALYAIAELQKAKSPIEKTTVEQILKKAQEYDTRPELQKEKSPIKKTTVEEIQKNAQEYDTRPIVVTIKKRTGKAISGNIENGNGIKLYTLKDSLVDVGWKYNGSFINGLESGKGILYNKAGKKVYDGDWTNGSFHGFGKLYSNTTKYEGQFVNGKKNGKAVLWDFSDSTKYEGDFKNNLKEGFGKMTLNDGNRSEGYYKNDIMDGRAKFYDSSNTLLFEGMCKNAKYNGQGTLYIKESGRIEGLFYGDKMNGTFTYISNTGTKKQIVYKDNEIVSQSDMSSSGKALSVKNIFESGWTGVSQSRSNLTENGFVKCIEKLYNIQYSESNNTFSGISLSTFTVDGKSYSCKSKISGNYDTQTEKVIIYNTGIIYSDPLPNNLSWLQVNFDLELGKDANRPSYFLLQGKSSIQKYSDEFISYETSL